MYCVSKPLAAAILLGCLAFTPSFVSRLVAFQGSANPVPASEATIKAGATVYGRMCRSCHGLTGKGDGIAAPPGTKPANLVDAEWKHGSSDAEIFKNIRQGIAPFDAMRPQKGLSDADIWSIIHYLRSLAAKK